MKNLSLKQATVINSMKTSFKSFSDTVLTKKIDIEIEFEEGETYVIGRRNGVRIEEAKKRNEDLEETIERVKGQFDGWGNY
jgi:hypothetical protein